MLHQYFLGKTKGINRFEPDQPECTKLLIGQLPNPQIGEVANLNRSADGAS